MGVQSREYGYTYGLKTVNGVRIAVYAFCLLPACEATTRQRGFGPGAMGDLVCGCRIYLEGTLCNANQLQKEPFSKCVTHTPLLQKTGASSRIKPPTKQCRGSRVERTKSLTHSCLCSVEPREYWLLLMFRTVSGREGKGHFIFCIFAGQYSFHCREETKPTKQHILVKKLIDIPTLELLLVITFETVASKLTPELPTEHTHRAIGQDGSGTPGGNAQGSRRVDRLHALGTRVQH